MLKTEQRRIGELDVSVTQFAGRRNLTMLLDLSKVVGPTIAAAAGGVKGVEGLLDADIDFGRIGQVLFASLDTGRTEKLVRDLLSATAIGGRPVDDAQFDALFAGSDLWTLPKILAFVIEVNFGNFSALAESVSGVVGQRAADQPPES